jgi:hypothetical protein
MKQTALVGLAVMVVALLPAVAAAKHLKRKSCHLGVAHPALCFPARQLARAEAIPIFPIDPPGADVWSVTHLLPSGEAITRYHGRGPVDGIYFAFGHRPTAGRPHSRYALVGELTHTFTITGSSGPPAGHEWTVTGVLPTTHVMLSVSGNESRVTVRRLARKILDLARARMSVDLKTVSDATVHSLGIFLYKPWVSPGVTRAQLTKIFQSPANPGTIVEAALARFVFASADQNQIVWVVALKAQGCGNGNGYNIAFVDAWNGNNLGSTSGC